MELVTPSLGLIVWTSIIFLSLLFVLSKFAWAPIASALKEREDFITEALQAAEKAKEEMANLKISNEKLLNEARLERDKILKEAQQAASLLINDAKERAASESAKMLENARLQISNEKNAAITELKNTVASTSILIAEQILKKNLEQTASQQELISNYLKNTPFN